MNTISDMQNEKDFFGCCNMFEYNYYHFREIEIILFYTSISIIILLQK